MSAPPVLLLHGFAGSTSRTWGATGFDALLADAGRQVLGIDLLGHGTAPKPHDPAAYDEMEALVLHDLPPEPVDAVGFSLGARVVLTLAAQHPERFGRMVLAGVGENLLRPGEKEIVLAALAGDDTEAGDDANPTANYFRNQAGVEDGDRDALMAFLRRPGGPPLTPAMIAGVTQPTLVVLGSDDFAGPAEPLLDLLPDARLVTLPGVDHFSTPKSFAFFDAALDHLDAR